MMTADELEIARQFLAAHLAGIREVREELKWITAPENFDLEVEATQVNGLGGGRIVTHIHELYRSKDTGEVAHTRDRQFELAMRDAKVTRYEMRIVG